MKTAWFIVRLTVLSLVLSVGVVAQTASTGALTGQVTDPNGAVVAGAQVTATNESTGAKRDVVSQENGIYTVALLLPGSYKVEISKQGFKIAVINSVPVNVTETKRLDTALEVGSMQERVVVVSDAQVLQTESPTLGSVANHDVVATLPLVTRNYTQIVTLSPGIAAASPVPQLWDAAAAVRARATFACMAPAAPTITFR